MIEELLSNLARALDDAHIPYMIIGGQAVLLYGRPRLTRDVDVTLGVDTDKFGAVERVCRRLRLTMLSDSPEEFARRTRVLPAEDAESKIRVDFIFSFTPYEVRALGRAREIMMRGYPVRFASCEDIIIHKMVSARAIDEEDVKSMLIKNEGSVDLEYVMKWLTEFSKIPEYSEILEKFNRLSSESSSG